MPSIGQEDDSCRFSVDGFRGDSPTFTSLCTDIGTFRSFSYHKLPQQRLKLSILKLDGSSFDVQVARTGSVAELKQVIEEFFNLSPKEGQGKISWSHVWGHFCLCFEGQKLLNDKSYIRNFGIKDGDQLCFIRHLSVNYNPIKKSRSCKVYHEHETTFSSGLDTCEEEERQHEDAEDSDGNYNGDKNRMDTFEEEERQHEDAEDSDGYYNGDKNRMDTYFRIEDGKNGDIVPRTEFKLAHFLRGWLSYSRLWGSGKLRSHSKAAQPSRFASLKSWDEGDSTLKVITMK